MVRARKITDEMAITAAHSIAKYAEKKGIHSERIMPSMDETEVFAETAADVAMEAIKNGVARIKFTRDEVYSKTLADIKEARATMDLLMEKNFIKKPDIKLIEEAAKKAIDAVKK